jgi:hypothetical protein
VNSRAVELGSGDIGKCSFQALALCVRSNGDDRVIVKEGIGSSALSQGLFYPGVQPVWLALTP